MGYFIIRIEYDDAAGGDACVFNCECADNSGNRTLKQLRDDLARRLGYGAQVDALPPGMTELLNSFLAGAQRTLYYRYDALRTERFYQWEMEPGVRFYDLDGNSDECDKRLDPRKVTWVGVSDGCNYWRPLIAGIPPELYQDYSHRAVPTRYEIRQCIEVWPAPDDSRWKLRVKGHFGLEPFTDDEHRTTIDDELVFLLALANAKAHEGHPDARNYFEQAEVMVTNLVAGSHLTRRYVPGARARSADPDPIWTAGGWPE